MRGGANAVNGAFTFEFRCTLDLDLKLELKAFNRSRKLQLIDARPTRHRLLHHQLGCTNWVRVEHIGREI